MTSACVIVAGEVDTIELLAGRDIHTVVDAIKREAIQKATSSGADPGVWRMAHLVPARTTSLLPAAR